MLTIKSHKTSLLDLTIEELRNVHWRSIDTDDFVAELNDIGFLTRLMYANKEQFKSLIQSDYFVIQLNEDALTFVLETLRTDEEFSNFKIATAMFYNRKQYSLEFIEKYIDHIHLNYAEHQKSLTPEFIEKYYDSLDVSGIFEYFEGTFGSERFVEFIRYNNGVFREKMLASNMCRYMTKADLEAADIEVPAYYNTVLTEQRVMSGDPCSDGQRSFTIWLRKYRRVFNDPTGYPTWDNLLEVFKKHRRMNDSGYIDWLFERALMNDDEYVSRHRETLEYRPEHVSRREYVNITEAENESDYDIEFIDVLNPNFVNQPVQIASESDDCDEEVDEDCDAEGESGTDEGPRIIGLRGREPNSTMVDEMSAMINNDLLMEMLRNQREFLNGAAAPARSWNGLMASQPVSQPVFDIPILQTNTGFRWTDHYLSTLRTDTTPSEQTERAPQPRDPRTGRFIPRS